jgi:dTDP-4-dehydrorhamnose reductase
MRPIVGLVHHGSGPAHTSLLDPGFAEGLADFARAVAERYPWVDGYTPVNEPLTTARFSGLYGLWHPHERSAEACVRILLNQCRGVILSMQAIRSVNPAAYLVQNEDLGRTYATPALAYEAEFQNIFRWLTFDLLCGMVNAEHPLWEYLCRSGAGEAELAWFEENACPPDILGLDHYLSGERLLDENVDRYPGEYVGGNGQHRFVNVLASRVLADGTGGPGALFREAWERYGRPLAITEVHNGCTREEQMRWFLEVWDTALALKAEGVDVRAVTAWAIFGLYGWDALCTQAGGTYEVGIYDARTSPPRPTAMVPLLSALARGERPSHPLLAVPGWWKRDVRLAYGHALNGDGTLRPALVPGDVARERVYRAPPLLIGVNPALETDLIALCSLRGIPYRLVTSSGTTTMDVGASSESDRPWAAIVDDSAEGSVLLAACEAGGVPVARVSAGQCSERVTLNDILDRLIDGESVSQPGVTTSGGVTAGRAPR